MAWVKASQEQFETRENEVVHKPTGTCFTAAPGSADIRSVSWGRASSRMPSEEKYRDQEIRTIAEMLLRKRLHHG